MLMTTSARPTSARSSACIRTRRARPRRPGRGHRAADARWWPPITWAWSTACGRSPTCRAIAAVAAVVGPAADLHRRRPPPLRDRLQVPRPCLRDRLPAPEHPANFVLMMFVAMEDPGLIVLPTHRLFRGLPADDAARSWPPGSATASRSGRPARARRRRRPSGRTSRPAATRARWACSPRRTSGG